MPSGFGIRCDELPSLVPRRSEGVSRELGIYFGDLKNIGLADNLAKQCRSPDDPAGICSIGR